MIAVLLSVVGAGVLLGAVVIARHRAQAIADLAALAGAQRLPAGPAAACAQAQRLGERMHAHDIACTVEELDLVITVMLPAAGWRWGPARASARAGPMG